MLDRGDVKAEGKARHKRAQKAVTDARPSWPPTGRQKKKTEIEAAQAAVLTEAAAELTPGMQEEFAEILP